MKIFEGEFSEMYQRLCEYVATLPKGTKVPVKLHMSDGKIIRKRIGFSTNEQLIIMAKDSRKYGYPLYRYTFVDPEIVKIEIVEKSAAAQDPALVWAKSWTKVLEILDKMNWWDEYRQDIRAVLVIGYDNLQKARALWDKHWSLPEALRDDIDPYRKIHPFLIRKRENGEEYVQIPHKFMYPAKVKKMNFGKYNDHCLARIAEAIKNNQKISIAEKAAYDVSFEFLPEQRRAFYSEEFRGCGNGHYYLAISATHAVFYEDD